MSASYFRSLAARGQTASRDSSDLFATGEFRQLATEFKAKADELDYAADDFMLWGEHRQYSSKAGSL